MHQKLLNHKRSLVHMERYKCHQIYNALRIKNYLYKHLICITKTHLIGILTRMERESNRTLPVQCNPCIHCFGLLPINRISPQTHTGFVVPNVLCICHRAILNKCLGSPAKIRSYPMWTVLMCRGFFFGTKSLQIPGNWKCMSVM